MGLTNFRVAVVGAGPAGLYGAAELAKQGANVTLLNRDVKPGGLAEYGIYPDKYKMKDGLRKQFDKILEQSNIHYLGNVTLGKDGTVTLDELANAFDAVLVTVGAQGTKWLGLPGEQLKGVYHAKELVYHYNRLPPFSQQEFIIGTRVIIVGVGNVMMDVAHWLIRERKVERVTAVARRGPAQTKFDKAEFEIVGANVDLAALDAELARCAPIMQAVGEDPAEARAEILAGLPRALPPVSATRFDFVFLASPRELCGDAKGRVTALEVEDNYLVSAGDDVKAVGSGHVRELACDTVIFAIGDQVDPGIGLPSQRGEYVKHPQPRFPVGNLSYEAYDPSGANPLTNVFVAGWARAASSGLVGVARKDGEQSARAVAQYLGTVTPKSAEAADALDEMLKQKGAVDKEDVKRLKQAEQEEAKLRGLHEFKFATNQEMLDAMCRSR